MTAEENVLGSLVKKQGTTSTALVTRSNVPEGLSYTKYRPHLRYDFFCSCAYCNMTESEAQAIRFTIDHYHPQTARPDLVDVYSNLMYACDECNTRKGDRYPPPEAQSDGNRFFRPDLDSFDDHFEAVGIRLEPKSKVGRYTILTVDLNRQTLRRLREIRSRLTKCDSYVAEGIAGLRNFHIDRLPTHIKAQAANAIENAARMAESMAKGIDSVLRDYAKSSLLELEQDAELEARTKERMESLKQLEGLYPGAWRAPRKKKR